MRKINLIVILLSFIFLINFVSSAPPFVNPILEKCLIIEHPISDPVYLLQDHYFSFHVYNCSDGRAVDLSLITCSFDLYNQSGMEIFSNDYGIPNMGVLDKTQKITRNNFSVSGDYSFEMYCNSSSEGGFYTHDFLVTPSGNQIDNQGIIILGSLIIIIILALVFFFIANNSETLGVKVVFYSLSGIFFIIAILYTVVIMQQTLFGFDKILSGIETFWFVVKMLIGLGIFALIIIVVIILFKSWKIKRGYAEE